MPEIRTFLLPDLGEGLEEAEMVAWRVAVGDHVQLNQDLCDVETAKASVTLPSPFAGVVVERFGEEGQVLEVGRPLVRIDVGPNSGVPGPALGPAEPADEPRSGEPRQSVLVGYGVLENGRRRRRRPSTPAPPAPEAQVRHSRPLAPPPVRKLARTLGIDLATVIGSGPHGRIRRQDLVAAGSPSTPMSGPPRATVASTPGGVGFRGAQPGAVIPLRGIRGRIADKMMRSHTEIPVATASAEFSCEALWEARKVLQEQAAAEGLGTRITPLVLVLRAVVQGLRRFPTLNATVDTGSREIRLLEPIHLGFAADTASGLVVPVLRNAHLLTTSGLAAELERLSVAARNGSCTPQELSGSTFTVSNYGSFGTDDGLPIINYPEAALLGLGAMKQRPWVEEGQLVVRRTMRLTLAFDHRISDGADAGHFLAYLGQCLDQPTRLLLHA